MLTTIMLGCLLPSWWHFLTFISLFNVYLKLSGKVVERKPITFLPYFFKNKFYELNGFKKVQTIKGNVYLRYTTYKELYSLERQHSILERLGLDVSWEVYRPEFQWQVCLSFMCCEPLVDILVTCLFALRSIPYASSVLFCIAGHWLKQIAFHMLFCQLDSS